MQLSKLPTVKTKYLVYLFCVGFIFSITNNAFCQCNKITWINPIPQGNQIFASSFPTNAIGYALAGNSTLLKSIDSGKHWTILIDNINGIYQTKTIKFTSADTGYIGTSASSNGILYKTTDGGINWTAIFNLSYTNIFTMSFFSNNIGYLPASNAIYKTYDGGKSWAKTSATGFTTGIRSMYFTSQKDGYTVAYTDEIFKTKDSGKTWSKYKIGTSGLYLTSIYFLNDSCGFTSSEGPSGTTFRTINYGKTWTQCAGYPFFLSRFINPRVGFYSDFYQSVYRSIDSGKSWKTCLKNTRYPGFFTNLNLIDSSKMIVTGDNGMIYRSVDTGKTWKAIDSPFTYSNFNSGVYTSRSTGYLCGSKGTILKTVDSGWHWKPLFTKAKNVLVNIFFVDSLNGYAVGDSNIVLKTTNAGATWTKVLKCSSSCFTFYSLFFSTKDLGCVVGEGGNIYRTTDGGKTWTLPSSGVSSLLRCIYFKNKGKNGFIVGDKGVILKSIDSGSTWKSVTSPTSSSLNTISFASDSMGFAGGNGLITTLDGGSTWKYDKSYIADVQQISFIDSLNGILSTNTSGITSSIYYKTNDGGKNWKSVKNMFLMVAFAVIDKNTVTSFLYNNILRVNFFPEPDPIFVSRCDSGSVVFHAKGGSQYKWYSKITDTTAIAKGDSFVTPVLKANTTYYVSNYSSSCESNKISATAIILSLPVAPSVSSSGKTKFCKGDSSSYIAAGSTGSYVWQNGHKGNSISVKDSSSFWAKAIDKNGCQSPPSPIIKDTIFPIPGLSAGKDTNICNGSSIFIGAANISGNSYAWTSKPIGFTNSNSNPKISPIISTTYYLFQSNSLGCGRGDSVKVNVDANCVYPGDANYDKMVDAKDVLNIGLGYGKTGPARPGATIGWYAQPCMDWKDTFVNAINYKHADCNGDSIIDSKDTLAIAANYSKTHLKTLQRSQGKPGDLPLKIVFSKDSLQAGDMLITDVILGDNTTAAKNFYALAFGINFDNGFVDTSTVHFDFNPCWFGKVNANLLHFNKNLFGQDRMDFALTRINHSDTSGYGPVCRITMNVAKTIPGSKANLHFTLSDNKQINHIGNDIPVYMTDDSILLLQTFTGINTPEHLISNLNIFPNPFSGYTNIEYTLLKSDKLKIEIFDILGRQISTLVDTRQEPGKHTLKFENVGATGQYILRIQQGEDIIYKRLVGVKE